MYGLSVMSYHEKPIFLSTAHFLETVGYFQRGPVREFIAFFSRTVMATMARGLRQTVGHEDYAVHLWLRGDGLGAVAVCDRDYPQRVAFVVLSQLLAEFAALHPEWSLCGQDATLPFPFLAKAIVDFQDPAKADKLTKIHGDLERTIGVVQTTIGKVLDRGVQLEELVKQSEDLGTQSKLFYKKAQEANGCCVLC